MQWWTCLDPEIQAAIIGVVGSLIGALIGGGMASRAGRSAVAQQWKQQAVQRGLDAVDAAIADFMTVYTASHDTRTAPDGFAEMLSTSPFRHAVVVLVTRARAAQQIHLASLVTEMAKGTADGEFKEWVRMGDVNGVIRAAMDWMIDPPAFESTAHDLQYWRSKVDPPNRAGPASPP
jgi:hypothetical protein